MFHAYSTTVLEARSAAYPCILTEAEAADTISVSYRKQGWHASLSVGFQEPLETIPAGMLLRVSLAHRWRPVDHTRR